MKRQTKSIIVVCALILCVCLLCACQEHAIEFKTVDGALYYKYVDQSDDYWQMVYQTETVEREAEFKVVDGDLFFKYTDQSDTAWQKIYEKPETEVTLNFDDNSRLAQLYAEAQEGGYTGTFLEYIALLEKASSQLNSDGTRQTTIQTCLRSAVSVWCGATESTYSVAGSGVIYTLDKTSGDAYVLTNCHVVYNTSANGFYTHVSVALYGAEYQDKLVDATVVGALEDFDVALLKISGSDVLKTCDAQAAVVNSSRFVNVGQDAYVVGNADGDGISVTAGIVSVDSEYLSLTGSKSGDTIKYREIRVDGAVNFGNSGGGLFDANGKLIGIVHAKNTANESMGFAIPVSLCVSIAEKLIATYDGTAAVSEVKKAAFNVLVAVKEVSAVYDETSGNYGIVETIAVSEIYDGSAALGILQVGDVLTKIEIDGVSYDITRMFCLIDSLWNVDVGDTVTIYYLRGSDTEEHSAQITFGESNTITVN